MKRVNEHYNFIKDKYEVLGVFLQGSQNYRLHYENSDIDTKAIIIPTLEDIITNKKPISTTIVLDNNEHIDVKDIRLMFDCFKKQNINFVEILFTIYNIINPKYEKEIYKLFSHNEKIARYNNYQAVKCMYGMVMEKRKALTHPYPSIKDKIDKFGFDGKQLHHIIRLNYFFDDYVSGKPYSKCLISEHKDYLIDVKKGLTHNLSQAIENADRVVAEMKSKVDSYMANNKLVIDEEVVDILNGILVDIFRKSLWEGK